MISDVNLLIILSTVIIVMTVMMMMFIYIYFLRQKSKLILKQKEENIKFENELSLSKIEIKEQTLNYVGQELHDELGQKLSVVLMISNKLQMSLCESQKESFAEIKDLVAECIQDIRNLSRNYITDQIEHFGLIDSVEKEVQRINRLDFISIKFNFNNHDVDINRKHSLILFRIIQECINNALRHSKAKNIEISIIDREQDLEIVVEDNGIGICDVSENQGVGLRNMKNRAKVINAEFDISSERNAGTKIKIIYPKKP